MSDYDDDWLYNERWNDLTSSLQNPTDGSQGTLSDISVSDLFQCCSSPSATLSCIKHDEGEETHEEIIAHSSNIDQDRKLSLDIELGHPSGALMSPDFSGDFNFEIGFEPQKKLTKASTWTYSKSLRKLYADIGKPCPMHFSTQSTADKCLPLGATIRCQAVFASTIHQTDTVVRCPNHAATIDVHGVQSGAPPNHFVRCDHRAAQYVQDAETGRHSVIVPYEVNAGSNRAVLVYRFMCRNTCLGNLNSRQVLAVFTLEASGEIIGRITMQLRICACPGRDRRQEEETPSDSSKVDKCKKTFSDSAASSKDDDQWYTMRIRGKRNFEILSDLKEALELRSAMSPKQKKLYKTQ